MEKIPCIKCDPKLWKYIKPHLERWGYDTSIAGDWDKYQLLVINYCGVTGCCNNAPIEDKKFYNREITNDVEKFLEKVASLKGFTYKREDAMEKVILNGIELKPGMVILVDGKSWIVFPLKNGYAAMNCTNGSWYRLENLILYYNDRIEAIKDIATVELSDGDVLWKKSKEVVITKKEIAKKFGCDVSQMKIV